MAFHFVIVTLLGLGIYTIGVLLDLDLVVALQWIRMNTWLKFISIIGVLLLIKDITESRIHRGLILGIFMVALIVALFRFQPQYDPPFREGLYGWIALNTDKVDVFLVPPELSDFKTMTLRSSYFDFNPVINHLPETRDWSRRLHEIYGINLSDRSTDDIFSQVKENYANDINILGIDGIDYVILRNDQKEAGIKAEFEAQGISPIFVGDEYIVFQLRNHE